MSESFYHETPSQSSFIDHFWDMIDTKSGYYPLYSTVKWGLVFSCLNGATQLRLIGPRTIPTSTSFAKDEYFFGVVINADVNLVSYTKKDLLNQIIDIPIEDNTFTLCSKVLHVPEYKNIDAFIEHLVSLNILYVTQLSTTSLRDQQRKIKHATGLTAKQIEQAERVDYAISLIDDGHSLSDIATRAEFSDQAHMTRDFKRLVGYSPAQIRQYFNHTHS
jgi:AraC-like DNA-binding protein